MKVIITFSSEVGGRRLFRCDVVRFESIQLESLLNTVSTSTNQPTVMQQYNLPVAIYSGVFHSLPEPNRAWLLVVYVFTLGHLLC